MTIRLANKNDIHAMHSVRMSVLENKLVSSAISEADYIEAIEHSGRGWVIEQDEAIVAFAIGNAQTGNIWALFVRPAYERHGHGRKLHDEMVKWLWSQGLDRLQLTTAPGTRAQRFYESAGWINVGHTPEGELRFELYR